MSEDGPYGFDPAGPELDLRIREAVASWDVEALLTMDEEFRERAGEDAVASISFLMGALDSLRVRPRVLSYEGPFGVGYMVAAVDILEDEEGRTHVEAEPAEAEPVEAVPRDTVAAAGPKHPLVRLARDAVEAFVRERRALVPPSSLEVAPARASCFVSLKTDDGALRGCIGSAQSKEPDLPREVVRNAIDAATTDRRFLPVNGEELPCLIYSVDVLTAPAPLEGLQELDPKRFGAPGHRRRRGLLLPDIEGVDSAERQVAIAKGKALIKPHEPVSLSRFEVERLR